MGDKGKAGEKVQGNKKLLKNFFSLVENLKIYREFIKKKKRCQLSPYPGIDINSSVYIPLVTYNTCTHVCVNACVCVYT